MTPIAPSGSSASTYLVPSNAMGVIAVGMDWSAALPHPMSDAAMQDKARVSKYAFIEQLLD
jgi:hypothetical protein